MSPLRTLVLGGARSGKSVHAEQLVDSEPLVRYIATAKRDPSDLDWESRIADHRRRRPSEWTTVESSVDLPATLLEPTGGVSIVDDLGTWLTSAIDNRRAWDLPRGSIAPDTDALVDAVTRCRERVLLVSPEVGLSVVPATRSGRLFQDEMGILNGRLSAVCDTVVLVIAGTPLTLKSPNS